MSKYQCFIFKDYRLDPQTKVLNLTYAYDDQLTFTETYSFDFGWAESVDQAALDRALQTLFFMAGVSYYKAYAPDTIQIEAGDMDDASAEFFGRTYQRGLGEFYYINKLNPSAVVKFPATCERLAPLSSRPNGGLLIGIGGGKDSLVSVELLRNQPKVATWSVNHRSQLEPLIQRIGLPHFWVEREWDQQLATLNQQGAYNGHIPISAILSAVGTVVAILSGYQDVVVSNENSANEPTLHYNGVDINHQYSKSLAYEQDYQQHLQHTIGEVSRYYSFLRPLSELRIAELFARSGFEKYQGVFSSCNKAYRHGEDHIFWCGECPKCAFVFMALTPFIDRPQLELQFGGKNLLLDPALEPTYRNLLGIEGEKPLDCVGEIKESRAAMRMSQQQYPELQKYVFELPQEYDFRAEAADAMPPDIRRLLP
jgi:hypothetical protein